MMTSKLWSAMGAALPVEKRREAPAAAPEPRH
jgi:hypothetical protein